MALLFEAVFRRGPPTAPVWGLGLIGLRESVSAVDKDVGGEARFERKVGMEQAPRSLVSVLLQKNLDAAQTFRMSSQHIPQINPAQEFAQQSRSGQATMRSAGDVEVHPAGAELLLHTSMLSPQSIPRVSAPAYHLCKHSSDGRTECCQNWQGIIGEEAG